MRWYDSTGTWMIIIIIIISFSGNLRSKGCSGNWSFKLAKWCIMPLHMNIHSNWSPAFIRIYGLFRAVCTVQRSTCRVIIECKILLRSCVVSVPFRYNKIQNLDPSPIFHRDLNFLLFCLSKGLVIPHTPHTRCYTHHNQTVTGSM